jgi:hypothetical protein
MIIVPATLKTGLASLLLAGCCSAVADPVNTQPATPVTPPAEPAAVTPAGPAVQAPVQANEPVTTVSPAGDGGNPGGAPGMDAQAHGPFDAEPETARITSPEAEGAGVTGMEDVPGAASATAPRIDPATLHGEWIVREQHPEAGEVVTLFSINPDSSFAGTMTVAGNVVWRYSGNWYLDGNQMTWFYTESTPPLMLVDTTEVDEIIAIDSEKLVYRSGKRDVLETLYRAR